MSAEKIFAFDEILKWKHAKVYSSLNKGRQIDSSIAAPVCDWYRWRDGQNAGTENLFFNWYRFISFMEAQQLCVWATDYSLPLLTDDAGLGYYFSTLNHKVFYNAATFDDKEDLLFSSFESFIEFLIELANNPSQSIGEFFDIEENLLGKYTL